MGEIVELPVQPAHPEDNQEFVVDCCRFAENILSEAAVKKKYHFDDATWERLGNNESLIEKIEAEKRRRIRDGSTKRERAQQLVVQAPDVLGGIMLDASASPKHRIDASKTLDAFAANGPEAAPASDPDPNDVDPHHIDDTPQGLLAVIAANKRKDDGGGEPI
jgi:hypothetical protein